MLEALLDLEAKEKIKCTFYDVLLRGDKNMDFYQYLNEITMSMSVPAEEKKNKQTRPSGILQAECHGAPADHDVGIEVTRQSE